MSALPLGVLTCQDSAGPTPVYFHYQEQCCRAVVVCTAPSGILVCIPRGGVSAQEFEEAETSGYVGAIGPFSEVEVAVSNSRAKRTLAAIIFDLDIRGSAAIVERVPDGFPRESVVRFNIYRGAEDLPNRAALLELATNFINSGIGERRLEPYYSAHEDGAELEEAETVDQVPETPVLDGGGPEEEGASAMEVMLHRLLTQSEVTQRTITGMHDRLNALESLEGRLSKLESGGHRAAPLPPPPRTSPQMFDGAGATLGPERLQHLQALAGREPGRLGDLGLHNRPKAAPQPSTAVAFAGTTEGAEGEDLDGEPWAGNAPDSSTVLEKLLASQSAILEKLANSRAAQQDPLASLGGASNLDSDDAPKSTGVRGIAARQMLVDSFRKSPQRVEQIFKERLATARRKGDVKELEARDLWYHFQDQVPLGSHRTLTHMAFMAAAMYEAMERNDNARLRMLVCMQAIFAEQASYDAGGLRMAHLITGLEDPPFAMTEIHRVPSSLYAHGQLSDPRWVATNLAYLRDLEGITDKSNKYVRPGNNKPADPEAGDDPPKKPRPPFKPKRPKKTSESLDEGGK